jgi:DNA-binding response OmpR family regulator
LSPSTAASNLTVLIVEDDLVSRSALQSIFRLRGMRVEVAGTVALGMQLLNTAAPEYLILDLMLPDGDGAKIMHEIRARGLPTTVAITTAISDPGRLKEVSQLEPAVLIRKPIDLVQLLRGLNLNL